MKRRERAFSLIEVVAAMSVLAIGALAVTAVWRLADYQAFVTRLDDRAARVLRECYELETFSPANSKPFDSRGTPTSEALTRGYLYHPWKKVSAADFSHKSHADEVPYTISLSADRARMILQYEVTQSGRIAARRVTRAIDLLRGEAEP